MIRYTLYSIYYICVQFILYSTLTPLNNFFLILISVINTFIISINTMCLEETDEL